MNLDIYWSFGLLFFLGLLKIPIHWKILKHRYGIKDDITLFKYFRSQYNGRQTKDDIMSIGTNCVVAIVPAFVRPSRAERKDQMVKILIVNILSGLTLFLFIWIIVRFSQD